ncbi:ataxin-2-like protein isoform X2 [Paramacrobiotus metropolitanus]|uniref:ataxin-2-like protein isoform X2 n=1 Tax=Paramacrobiotus metropolitanus TaxID=2943436 RepID=UPI002446538B|nr:ataxin-2-like protein isoform X2 [Paramacrobiotus metropolitanus]
MAYASNQRTDYGRQYSSGSGRGGAGGPAGDGGSQGPSRVPSDPPFSAFVGNLHQATVQSEIGEMFNRQKVKNIRMLYETESKNFRGVAFVEFVDKESLTEALNLDGMVRRGRNIRVDVADRDRYRDRANRFSNDRGGAARGRGGSRGGYARSDAEAVVPPPAASPASTASTPHSQLNSSQNSHNSNRSVTLPEPVNDMMSNPRIAHPCIKAVASEVVADTITGVSFEGVLQSFNKKGDTALAQAHKVAANRQHVEFVDFVLLERKDLVSITVRDIGLRFLRSSQPAVTPAKRPDTVLATDEALAKTPSAAGNQSARNQPKELVKWEPDNDLEIHHRLDHLGTGWSAEDMFRQNERNFGVKSSFDQSMSQYTVPLTIHDGTDEGRRKISEAQRLADEIERQPDYRQRANKENADEHNEEELFSAVVRPGGDRDRHHDRNNTNTHHDRNNDFRSSAGARHPRHSARGAHASDSIIITRNPDIQTTPSFPAHREPASVGGGPAPAVAVAAKEKVMGSHGTQTSYSGAIAARRDSSGRTEAPVATPVPASQPRAPQATSAASQPKIRSFDKDYTPRASTEGKSGVQRSPDATPQRSQTQNVWTRSSNAPSVPNIAEAGKSAIRKSSSPSERKNVSVHDNRHHEEHSSGGGSKPAPSPVSHRKQKSPHESASAPDSSSAKPPPAGGHVDVSKSQLNPEAKEFTPRLPAPPPALHVPAHGPADSPSPVHADLAGYMLNAPPPQQHQQQQHAQQFVYSVLPAGNFREIPMNAYANNAGNPYANYALNQTSPVGSPAQMSAMHNVYSASLIGQQQMGAPIAQFPPSSRDNGLLQMYQPVSAAMVSMPQQQQPQRMVIAPQASYQEINPSFYGYQMNMNVPASMYAPILYQAQAPPGGPFQLPANGAGFLMSHAHPGHPHPQQHPQQQPQHIPVSAAMQQMLPGNYNVMMMAGGQNGPPGGMLVRGPPQLLHPHHLAGPPQ